MSRLMRGCIPLTLMLAATGPGVARQSDLSLRITVRVYNYAKASTAILRLAESEASRIFQSAGLETRWVDCLGVPAEDALPPCRGPLTPTDIILRILAERGSTRRGFRDAHLGFALPSDKGGFHASIFYPDVESVAEKEGIPQDVLLGHGMAHEIGHLLLNSSAHFQFGLMRGKWDSKDLQHAARGDLLFTAEQASYIRTEVLRRTGQSQVLSIHTLQ